MREPVIGAVAGLASVFRSHGGTVTHRLDRAVVNVVATFGTNVPLGVGDGVGSGAAAGFGFGIRFEFGFGFGIGIYLSCLPCCSCWRSSGYFCPPVCVRSARIEDPSPAPSELAFLFSLTSHSIPVTTFATILVMSLPHSTSPRWNASHISSFSLNYVFITCNCASCNTVCVSNTQSLCHGCV